MKAKKGMRIGAVGAGGRMTGVLEQVLRFAPEARVTAVFEPDKEFMAEPAAKKFPDAVFCESAEALCQREDVDWVFIGSPNKFHAAQAVAAFKAGKSVFGEKPIALTLADALAMRAACRESKATFALGLVLRYSPLYRAAREAIEAGRIGKIITFEFNEMLTFNHGGYILGNWRRFTALSGGHMLEKCCHDLDLAMWLTDDVPARVASFGGLSFFKPENAGEQQRVGPGPKGELAFQTWPDPRAVNPFTSEKDVVDNQIAIMEFSKGSRATFHTCCLSALPERRFYMLGTEGSLRLNAYTGKLEICRIGWDQKPEEVIPISGEGHAGADRPMCQNLVACMRGESAPAASFDEGIRSLIVAQALDRSMYEGRVTEVDLEY